MQALLAAEDPGASALADVPSLVFLAIVTGLGVGASLLLQSIGRTRVLAPLHRFVLVVHVGVWASVVAVWLRRVIPGEEVHGIARGVALLVVAIAALPWLRNLFHAVVFRLANRYRVGDDLQVGAVEGRLVGFGAGVVLLRMGDGTEVAIPHTRLAEHVVVRRSPDLRDAPCELVLPAPPGVALETAARLARTAAALCPYAAPRRAPEVYVVTDEPGVRLRLRGFVFDREHEQRYRSDVGTRFMRWAHEARREAQAAPDPAAQTEGRPHAG